MPPALLNMRRAIVIFFITLIASSLSVLAVTLVSHESFQEDMNQIITSIDLVSNLANLRLTFRLLLIGARAPEKF